MPNKRSSNSGGSSSGRVERSAKTGSFSKRGGYSSSGKPVSQLRPPPSGSGAGSKKK
jgi:hypothetical protein